MSEFKNNQNPKRFKKHIHINVSSDSYSFWQKNGFNLSRFVENALNRLRLGITTSNADGIEANPMDLLLICTKNAENNKINTEKEQNNLMPSAGIEPATYRSSVFPAISANKGNIGRISRYGNFSGLAGKPSDRDFPDYEDINNGNISFMVVRMSYKCRL